ncbi:MAG: asparagine synthase B [Spirochaetales bacterium]|nr:asparagine synthase B [Spirochaetales bacterium]
MCGITGILDCQETSESLRSKILMMSKKLRHRGPDWSGIYQDEKCVIAHERLSIVDVETGAQPLYDKKNGNVLAVNGEIYNHVELRKSLKSEHLWQTRSDCEVLLYLYDEFGPDFVKMINGIFAFALYEPSTGKYLIARDHIGIIPLYIGWDEFGQFYFASEMKALVDYCTKIEEFPPGHYYLGDSKSFEKYYAPEWQTRLPSRKIDPVELRLGLEASVKRQLMSDVPYGILISGGLDSSIIAAIAAKYADKRVESGDTEQAWWPRLHSFSIGLEGSPDLAAAKKVADALGTVHHSITYTIQEGFDAIPDVIYHLETYDVTTIRAATPMFLMARKIKSMGIKMILSGEGADEAFGGYLYFHKAPNKQELHAETVRKLGMLNKYDCLRANKSTSAWGLETRVPFLDKEFLDLAMSFDPQQKMCVDGRMEKHILREAFTGYIPDEVLWRQKEQFSDGVGYGWIDYLKEFTEKEITDQMMENASKRFHVNVPMSKEEYYYRTIFDKHFPHQSSAGLVPTGPTIACSSPTAYRWSKEFEKKADPSGRSVFSVHNQAT